jgi:alpha-acetolactate decarboxylase
LKSRSVRAQTPPYPPPAEVIKTDQVLFNHGAVAGTLVGFRFPPSAAGPNVPGWHFHFVDDGRRLGGHVLDLVIGEGAVAGIQGLDGVRLTFGAAGGAAKDAALEMVEKGR